MPNSPARFYDLGPFRLDAVTCLLFREGKRVPIRPKASEVLRVLVRHHGELVEKNRLLEEVWADVEVEEGNISQYILELRKLFRPVSNGQEWIETVPRRGYRFLGPVRVVEEAKNRQNAAKGASITALVGEDIHDSGRASGYRRWLALAAISAAAVLVGATALVNRVLHPPQPRVLKVVELTHDGSPKSPYSLASDGSRLYFRTGDPGTACSVPVNGGESTPVNPCRASTNLIFPRTIPNLSLASLTLRWTPSSGRSPHEAAFLTRSAPSLESRRPGHPMEKRSRTATDQTCS